MADLIYAINSTNTYLYNTFSYVRYWKMDSTSSPANSQVRTLYMGSDAGYKGGWFDVYFIHVELQWFVCSVM